MPLTTEKRDELLQSVAEKVGGLLEGENPIVRRSEIREFVEEIINDMTEDEASEFTRKFRAIGDAGETLAPSKFGRMGASVEDVEMAYAWLRAWRDKNGNAAEISDDLRNAFKSIASEVDGDATEFDKEELKRSFANMPSYWYATADELARNVHFEETAAYRRGYSALTRSEPHHTGSEGFGAELVGVQYANTAWMANRREDVIFPLISSFQMTAPTAFFPVEADLPEMYHVPERTTHEPQTPYPLSRTGSNHVQVDAHKFSITQVWSGEMVEDSLIPIIPFYRRQLAKSLQLYRDSIFLNGDSTIAATGNINSTDAAPFTSADGNKHYLAIDGIRHASLVDTVSQSRNHGGDPITLEALFRLKALLIDRAENWVHDWSNPASPNDLVYIVNSELAHLLTLIPEFITVEKYGARATVLTGEIGMIGRHRVLVTPMLGLTTADGHISATAANNTKHQALLMNRNGLVTGVRRRITVEMSRTPRRDQTEMITFTRLGFGRFSPTGKADHIKHQAMLYNIGE